MDKRETKKMLDAIKANVDEILDNLEDDGNYDYCAIIADTIDVEAKKIGGFCREMALVQEYEKKKQRS